jgi:DNA invertase Pin-like site-specific DNA recombinase
LSRYSPERDDGRTRKMNRGRPAISPEVLAKAVEMKQHGATYLEIDIALRVGKTTVYTAFKKSAEDARRV